MFLSRLATLRPVQPKQMFTQIQKCHSVFGFKNLIQQDKPYNFVVSQLKKEDQKSALEIIKEHYLPEHVLVRARNMDISNDQALDEYLVGLLKQGTSLLAKLEDGSVAGLCVNFACSPIDPRNLRHYAFYRQDPNIKDFLYFTAKLQETPNLFDVFKRPKVFEIKMLTVVPEFRRQGLAVLLAERSLELAQDLGHHLVRMDCINPHDYKIAERCMLECITKFPLHKLRGPNAPFIKSSSEHNALVRVYVAARAHSDDNKRGAAKKLSDMEVFLD